MSSPLDFDDPGFQALVRGAVKDALGNMEITVTIKVPEEKKPERKQLTTQDLCDRFGVRPPTIYKYVRECGLPALRTKPLKFYEDEVDEWEKVWKKRN